MEVDMVYCKRLLILSVITQVGVMWAGFKKKPALLNLASFLTYHLSYVDASADSFFLCCCFRAAYFLFLLFVVISMLPNRGNTT